MIYAIARTLLFRLDAEAAHDLITLQMVRLQSVPPLLQLVRSSWCAPENPRLVWGLRFRNPFGIAAGFDKNAEMIAFLVALGFGFVEAGTVTLRSQPGNPRPRMFRYPEQEALVNRLGFNNEGARAVAERLGAYWSSLSPGEIAEHPPVLVNIGKNRDVTLDAAAEDYLQCYRLVAPHADGVVVNVSSPNTAALRDLQRPEHLEQILRLLRDARSASQSIRPGGERPIIVKIAPDLDEVQLGEICDVVTKLADGLTATNTTIDKSLLRVSRAETGGLSGRPLFLPSTRVLAAVRELVGPGFPLIGVGGVFDAADARAKLDAGADLVQAYTGLVYRGPAFASEIVRGLHAMSAQG